MFLRLCNCWPTKRARHKRREKERKKNRVSMTKRRPTNTNKKTFEWKKEDSSIRLSTRSGFAQVPTSPTTTMPAGTSIGQSMRQATPKLSRPSTPSQMKTVDVTHIIRHDPNETTVEEILHWNGYKLENEIGKGSFGSVYRALDLINEKMVACKVIDISKSSKNQSLSVRNELYIMESVNHPHIIRLYRHFIIESPKSRQVYIFMQLAKSKSLSVYVRSFKTGLPEQTTKKMFAQIVSAINHLHSKHIAHRDIKMGNVLLDEDNNCLVTDFGLSRIAFRASQGKKILTNKFCGTMPYMAPEILLTRDNKLVYDPFPADIWALGVLLYCMINRGYPFPSDSSKMLEQQMIHKIRFGKKMQFEPSIDLIDLFQRILEPNAELRLRMDQLMKHPWIIKEINIVERNVRQFLATENSLSVTMKTKNQAMWARESFLETIAQRKMAIVKKLRSS
ncbi:protein kinase-like protein [Euroglyphus maynei]|uniref:Protein kinase-like protein n=1 Tax=Euroglyphus maynei TaxID=6958 RepID=A0A1Y3AYA3_EURMA|nr:protein kinase-like protein [Euroglyphus maynei]